MRRFLTLAFIALNLTVSATDYYVSSSGNDAANGLSESTPWKSISKVNSACSSLQPGDKILFKRGDTFYGSLTITASGVAGNPLIIGAYGSGSNPVITGLTTLSSWTSEGNGIYSKTVSCESTPNLVLFNGTPKAIGRWPNTGSMTFESHSGTTSISDYQLSGTPNWTNAELAIRSNDYTLNRIRITSHSGTTISFASGSLSSEPRNGYGYWIQNDIRTLDVTGEWYYNGSRLYMYFGASNPVNYSVKIATLDILAKVKAARYVMIENISFSGANNSGVTCEGYNVNNLTVQNCTIANTGSYGVRFADPTYAGSYMTISNCTIENSLSAGINITGNYKYNTITGNNLRNIGYIEGMGSNYCGITVFGDNTTIERNTINNIGYNGIYPFCSNLSIKNNVISNFCTVIDDGGGIFMGDWADKTNKVITGNIIFNGFGAPNGGGPASPRLARGIFIDSSTGATGSKYIEVTYNTVFNCAWDGIYITDGNNYVTVENNTIYNNFLQFQIRNWNTAYSESNINVRNNIFYAKSPDQSCFRFQTITNTAFSSFGTSDYNYIARPVDDDYVFFTYQPSAEWISRTLDGWRSFSGQDLHSVKAPVTVTDTANIDFYYNTGSTDKVIILDRPMIDPKGRRYSASVTLSPFSSVILMVDPNPPEPVPVTLTVNATPVNAEISVPGENDWYKFQTGSAGSYSITTYGSTDTYMYLYQNDKATLITENDDGAGSGYNAKITQNLSANTVYYVRVKAYSVTRTGSYSIDVKYTPSVTTLTVGASATAASISTGGENDWYKFLTGTAGTYAVQTYGSSDTYMYLYQSDQATLIAENDDGAGSGYNSKITLDLSANTWYYVKIKLYKTTATGDYSIDVKDLTPTTLVVGAEAAQADISVGGENDWYKFFTGVAGNYSIQTFGYSDTYMYLYASDQTTQLAQNDDGAGAGYNSKITQSLNANTWYYVRVRLYNSTATGAYSISVKDETAVILTVNAVATEAAISNGGEVDWYKFRTGAAGAYAIQTYGNTDTYMYLYMSDQTSLINLNDDGGEPGMLYNSKLTENLAADTWYFVRIKLYKTTATGDYSIDVKDLTPTTLVVGAEAAQADISVGGENDWYKFFTGVAGNYSIQTFGYSDTYMYLYASDQTTQLAQNDDGAGAGYNSKITQSLNANTWYYVRVRLYNSTATGAYSISVKDETAVILTVNAVATEAAISNGGEVDWYKFRTGAAGAYAIQTYGNSDTYMYLYMSDQTSLINLNDDGGEPGMLYNSKLTENLAADTWYFVRIKLYNSTATGSYSIDVSDASAVTLIVDAPATDANISPAGENDWYRFQTSTAGSYSIQTSGSSDTYMYLYDSDKITLISENDDGAGVVYNAKITANLSAGSIYYVKVRLYKSTVTGYYAINVTKNESSKGSGEYMKAAPAAEIIKKDDQEEDRAALLIYPNPAIDKITVEFTDELTDMIRLEIISASGRKVYTEHLASDQQINETINVSELPAGLYFVRIVKTNRVITGKFIKRR